MHFSTSKFSSIFFPFLFTLTRSFSSPRFEVVADIRVCDVLRGREGKAAPVALRGREGGAVLLRQLQDLPLPTRHGYALTELLRWLLVLKQ